MEIPIKIWILTRPKKGAKKRSKNVPFSRLFWWHLRGGTSISVSKNIVEAEILVAGLGLETEKYNPPNFTHRNFD